MAMPSSTWSLALLVVYGLAATFFASTPATAQVSICNDTATETIDVAIGYYVEAGKWASRGWYRYVPGQCGQVIAAPIRNQYFYLYAISGSGKEWSGEDARFCVTSKAFNVAKVDNCEANGWITKRLQIVDTRGNDKFTSRITCSSCGRAPTAGAELTATRRDARNPYSDAELAAMGGVPRTVTHSVGNPSHGSGGTPTTRTTTTSQTPTYVATANASHGQFKCEGNACGDIELSFVGGCHTARNLGGHRVNVERGAGKATLAPGQSWQLRNPFGGECLTVFVGATTATFAQ